MALSTLNPKQQDLSAMMDILAPNGLAALEGYDGYEKGSVKGMNV